MFENRKMLILGMGREGQSTLSFFKKYFPGSNISTTDKKDGDNYLDNLKDFDLVIKSPGIPSNLEKIREAKKSGIKFTSQTQIFLELFRDRTIGITGTKGKSTTASLIYNILKVAGKNAKLVGNIGNPVLDNVYGMNDKSLFVYEMSSHQLSDVTVSPHIAVLLNIYPEHLDYYQNFDEYFRAKTNIVRYQSPKDIFIFNRDFDEISDLAKKVNSKKVSFSSKDNLEKFGINIESNPLLGKHNLNNISAAILTAQSLNIEDEFIERGIESFKPLEDRLELVKKVGNVSFINDGLATIPQATISAVLSFNDKNITLILGGFDRGIDFDILGKFLSTTANVKNIILIGQTANKFNQTLLRNQFQGEIINLGVVSMKEIVEKAYEITKPEGIVLLSPSATSFDMFKDYKDRDDHFKDAVENLK